MMPPENIQSHCVEFVHWKAGFGGYFRGGPYILIIEQSICMEILDRRHVDFEKL